MDHSSNTAATGPLPPQGYRPPVPPQAGITTESQLENATDVHREGDSPLENEAEVHWMSDNPLENATEKGTRQGCL